MADAKEPIKLRKRKMASGNTSLYLDIYLDGKRTYEYLRLYLIPETNKKDRETNKQTLLLAEAIKAKRVVELRMESSGLIASTNLILISLNTIATFASSDTTPRVLLVIGVIGGAH